MTQDSRAFLRAIAFGLVLLVPFVWTGCTVSFTRGERDMVVSGSEIRRVISGAKDRLRTKSIVNEVSKRELETGGSEFVLTWSGGEVATSDDFELVTLEETADGVVAGLRNIDLGLVAEANAIRAAILPVRTTL